MKGLAFRKTADAIAAFVKQHGASAPRRAVLCTYDLDPARFEAVLLPELTRRRRWFRTLVLADAASLQKHGVLGQRAAASSYELAPVRVNGPGVFHPKLIVLQAGARVLVGIGSGNLTAGGLGGNLEMMLFATNEAADGTAIAESAIQFLDDLRAAPRVTLPISAKRFLERVSRSASGAKGGPVLHSLDQSLIEQLPAGRPGRVNRVQIMSPWHSTSADTDGLEPDVIARVGKALGAAPRVYTQGHAGKAPALGKKTEVRILRASAYGGDEDLDAESEEDVSKRVRRPARLHAKAYLAVGATNATLWFGSANCTLPALCRVAGRGNVELLARAALDRNALARFECDLDAMFERASGTLPPKKTPRIQAPRGIVLAGHVDTWEASRKLEIEVLAPARSTRLRVGTTSRRRGTIEIDVPKGATSIILSPAQSRRLLQDREVPPVLWEHVAGTAIPFPISVPCAPTFDDPEAMLDDVLDDFAGRVPSPFRTKSRRDDGGDDDDLDDEDNRDRELALLTESEHQGTLDRIAVRVELLRRRLAAIPAARSHYAALVERLSVPTRLRRILIDHLGPRQANR
ncbi:MAG: hypothetical protein AB7T06_26205 [Kofleriaceae bacterium]